MQALHRKFFLIVAGLVLAIGSLAFYLQMHALQLYALAMTQTLNEPLAQNLANRYFSTTGSNAVDLQRVEVQFRQIMAINPSIELYLTDMDGRIQAVTPPASQVRRDRIDLRPVHDLISGEFVTPIFGDDPKDPDRKKIFSASALKSGKQPAGFLYIILGGSDYDGAAQKVQGGHLVRTAAIITGSCVSIGLMAAFFMVTTITRRLGRLAAAIDAFTASRFRDLVSVPAGGAHGGDEIDRLTRSYNLMAGMIQTQIQEIAASRTLRRDLIEGVSHDLRTPLALITGYIETLIMKDQTLSPEERLTYLGVALRQSKRTNHLVEELFELAKLDDDIKVGIQTEPFQLAELVQDVVLKFKLKASEKNISLTGQFAPDIPLFSGHIALIERLLDNLLDNAIRHTPDNGQVNVALTLRSGYLRIEVSDTGSGIAAEDLPHVFNRLFRGGSVDQTNSGGGGLGLAIARRIAELHHGRISVESSPGAGTHVLVELPMFHDAARPGP